ncbi:hypothetical protein TNCV_2241791, partial [Trichonephila clavipes]
YFTRIETENFYQCKKELYSFNILIP